MNAERLLAQYARIADAPDAIARLRRFILDLAVRGKLVEQDPNDEPAAVLLVRIAAEKARLVKAGEIRKTKSLPDVEPEEIPFDAPRSWEWVRIRKVTSDRGQTKPDKNFTYIDVTAINKKVGCIEDAKVTSASEAPSRARKIVRKGDVLYSCVRPYLLNIAIVETEISPTPIASTAFAVLNGFELVLPRYQWIVLRSPFLVACVEEKMRGQAYPAINDSDFSLLPFPLPPLAEQHRIVAKVGELMALCDRLAAARREREAVRDRLAAASLARLNAPDPATFKDDARFALDALPALTARPDQIKQLRQTILNFAIRGKLVPQDEGELPNAPVAKSKRTRYLKPLESDEIDFDLPGNWLWVRLGVVSELINGDRGKNYPNREEYVSDGLPFINTGHIEPDGSLSLQRMNRITKEKFEALRGGKIQPGDLVYCLRGATIGKTAFVVPFTEGAIASSLVIIRLDGNVDPSFAYMFLTGPVGRTQIRRFDNGSAQPNLAANSVKLFTIPLPPLAEQHRIVAKVGELMALCDQLEAGLTTGEDTRRRLLDALLHAAVSPKSREMEAAE